MVNKIDEIRDGEGKLPSFAWPGGYPMFYITEGNSTLCPNCANESDDIIDYCANWEDSNLYCDQCSKRIESAYAED